MSGKDKGERLKDVLVILWLLAVLGVFFRQPMVADLFSYLLGF